MRRPFKIFFTLMSLAVVLGCTGLAHADWASLDSQNSSVNFVSIKLNEISEIHSFDSVSGSISDAGKVTIEIEAASINSGIEIRDERMQESLFMVMDYPQITVRAKIKIDALPGGVSRLQFPAVVNLKGVELLMTVDAFVFLDDESVTVSSATPVIVTTAQSGFAEGVATLSDLAGGIAIGGSVPVSFFLSFKR